jgi:hypothetical protein
MVRSRSVGLVLACVVLGGAASAKPAKHGANEGTPEAWFADLPAAPTSVDDAKKRFDDTDVLKKLADRFPTATAAAGGAPVDPTDPQMMEFMRGWMDVGAAGGEKMYRFREQKDAIEATNGQCVDAEMQRTVPDHHEGLTKCANAYLAAVAVLWPDYVAATHDVVVAKADYIATFRAKAKSAGFKAFLDGQYTGLWIHPSNTLQLLQDIVNHGHVSVN